MRIIDDLKAMDGVIGAGVHSVRDGLVAASFPPLFNAQRLDALCQCLTCLEEVGRKTFRTLPELTLAFQDLQVLARWMASQHFLFVVHDASVRSATVAATARMAQDQLESDLFRNAFTDDVVDVAAESAVEDLTLEQGPLADALTTMRDLMPKVMGPMGNMIFDEAVEQWKGQADPSRGRLKDLLTLLEREIADPERIGQYRDLIAPQLGKFLAGR